MTVNSNGETVPAIQPFSMETSYWYRNGPHTEAAQRLEGRLVFGQRAEAEHLRLLQAINWVYYDRYNNGWGNGPHREEYALLRKHEAGIKARMQDTADFDVFCSAFEGTNLGEQVTEYGGWYGDRYLESVVDAVIRYVDEIDRQATQSSSTPA